MAEWDSGHRSAANANAAPTALSSSSAGAARVRDSRDDSLQQDSVLGERYRILTLLGVGGMGAVYKAEDLKLNRLVALKIIRKDLADDRMIMQRFKQELILAREITHRNVVRLYDIGDAGGVDFITMEFIEGEDLGSLLQRQGKLPAGEAADIVSQICAGLQAAHTQGVIHRDLKPGNIMRDQSGRVVVMDFGLARTLGNDSMTRSGGLVGTFEYMSPEQATSAPLDARSDLYTVGLIFYELLTGVRPFQADSTVASLVLRTQERAKPASSHEASIPKAINSICSKCLETAAANRYQSAAELIADIENWKSPASAPQRMPWRLVAIAAMVIAITVLAGIFLLRPKPAPNKPLAPLSVLVSDFNNNTGDAVFNDTLEPMLNLALEGASFINAYDRSQAHKLASKLPHPAEKLDEETARLVAVSQGISTVVTGELSRDGNGYRISAKAIDAGSGKVLAKSDITAGNKDGVLSAIPKLAAPIRKALGDTTPPSVQFEEVAGGFTAASLEAVHENATGVEEQFAGKFEEAFQSFQRATQIDPKFARAYTGMAAMARNLGRPQEAEKYMKLAMENVDRMTERERYRDRGLYYLSTGDWQKCVEEYGQLVARYPADRVGQNNLSNCYTQLRDAPKALEAAKLAVQIVPKGVGQRFNLSFISSFAGDFTGGEREARAAFEINPSAGQGYLALGEAQLGQAKLDQAAASYHQLEKFGAPGASIAAGGLADLAAYQGRFAEAARILEQSANADLTGKMNDSGARKLAALATIKTWQGDKKGSLEAADKALSNSQSVPIRFLAAVAYVEAGQSAKAQKIAAGLSSELTSEPQAYAKIIEGVSALKRGDARQAIKPITDANSLLDTWIGRFELGRAYLEAGAFPEADSEFDRCLKRRGEAIELFIDNVPTYSYLPSVYYYEGRVREGMKSDGYKDFYRTYLGIRGESGEDPLVPEVRRLGQ